MGLLSQIISERFQKDRDEANAKLDAYRAVISSPTTTTEGKQYALDQLLKTAQIKGKDQGPVAQMFGHLLGIRKPQQQGQFQPPPLLGIKGASQQQRGPSDAPIPGGGPMVQKTPQPQQQPQQQPAQIPAMPKRMFKTDAEVQNEQLAYEQKHQDILTKSKVAEQEAALRSRIILQKEANEKLTPAERKDLETARGLVQAEGGDSSDSQQVQSRLSKMIADRESAAKEQSEANIKLKGVEAQKAQADAMKSMAVALKNKAAAAGEPAPTKKDALVASRAAQDPAMDLAAWDYLATGKTPSLGLGKEAGEKKWQVIQRAGQIAQDLGLDPSNLQAYRSDIAANRGALGKMTWQQAAINQFEGTVERNMVTAEKLNEKFTRTNYPLANRVITYMRTGSGDPVTANFIAQMDTIATEYAKVMQGSTSATGATVNSDKEAREIINGYLSKGQIDALFDLLRTDMSNRKNAISGERSRLVDQIKGIHPQATTPAGAPQPAQAPGHQPQTFSHTATDANGNKVGWNGKEWVAIPKQ